MTHLFQTGGPLKKDSSVYIEREADKKSYVN